MPSLSLSLGLGSNYVSGSSSTAMPTSGLSLWLKADAGVITQSYSYKSNITLSLAGESSINGSYTTSSPGNGTTSYIMNGPNNNKIEVRPNSNPRYRLYNSNDIPNNSNNPRFYSFTSSDGITWSAYQKKPVSITLSGLTGTSAQSNGTYNQFEWESENGSFFSYKSIAGSSEVETSIGVEIYPQGLASAFILAPDFFVSADKSTGWGIGSWTIQEGTGSPVGTGTLYPTGGVPTGVVTTTNVNTTNVTSWLDQSPLGNTFYGVGNPILNSLDLNSKPTIRLSNTDYSGDETAFYARSFSSIENPQIMGSVGTTAFAVVFVDDVCSNSNGNGAIFGNFGTAGDGSHYPYGPNCSVYDSFATTTRKGPLTSPVTITNAWSLYSVVSTSNDWRAYINGQLMHSNNTNVYSNEINNSDEDGNGHLLIGVQYQNGDQYLNGKVAEIVVYNRVLTTLERQAVQTYLNTKYAIYS
jgi:hypothetical protein